MTKFEEELIEMGLVERDKDLNQKLPMLNHDDAIVYTGAFDYEEVGLVNLSLEVAVIYNPTFNTMQALFTHGCVIECCGYALEPCTASIEKLKELSIEQTGDHSMQFTNVYKYNDDVPVKVDPPHIKTWIKMRENILKAVGFDVEIENNILYGSKEYCSTKLITIKMHPDGLCWIYSENPMMSISTKRMLFAGTITKISDLEEVLSRHITDKA